MANLEEIWKKNLENLLTKAEQGNESAVGALYKHYYPVLKKLAEEQGGTEEDVQETFTYVFSNLKHLQEKSEFEIYVKQSLQTVLDRKKPAAPAEEEQPAKKNRKALIGALVAALLVGSAAGIHFYGIPALRKMRDNRTAEKQEEKTAEPETPKPETPKPESTEKPQTVINGADTVKGEGVMTHAGYASAGLDEEVTVETYIQGRQSWWNGSARFYTQDAEGGYFIYNMPCTEEEYRKLTPGTKIRVHGYKTEWAGETEIDEGASWEILEGSYIAEPVDVTNMLGTAELISRQNMKVSIKGMTAEAVNDAGDAFLYNWDGSGSEGDDLYFNVSKDGLYYTFIVESNLTGPDTDVYQAVKKLRAGDVIDLEGFLYWYEGPQTHVTSVSVVSHTAAEEKKEPVRSVIWAEAPGITFDEFSVIEMYTEGRPGRNEKIGYPMEWDNYADGTGLGAGLVMFREGRVLKITSFDRQNTVREVNMGNDEGLPDYSAILGFVMGASSTEVLYGQIFWMFSRDLTSAQRIYTGGIGGDFEFSYYDSETNRIMKLTDGTGPAINPDGGQVLTIGYAQLDDGTYHEILYVADDQGYVYDQREENDPHLFVNGYYVVSNQQGNLYGLKRISSGEAVTEPIYEDIKYFEDGYCPVKKNGKWGFVDEQGNEVTDFIWDDVTSLYQGKCYVQVNGVYGILDLKQTLDAGIPVTVESVYGSAGNLPQGQPKAELTGPIGTLTVLAESIPCSDGPTGDYSTQTGEAKAGMQFEVYEFAFNDFEDIDQTWYRIGKDQWIPDGGGQWLSYTAY